MNTSPTNPAAPNSPPPKRMPVPALELPHLTLRVGLIGNRTASSGAALDSPGMLSAIRQVFEALGKESVRVWETCGDYRREKPALRFVTGMASGSDQILSQEGMTLRDERFRQELFVIYPFDPTVYHQINPRNPGTSVTVDWTINLAADYCPDLNPTNPDSPSNAPARRSRQRAYQAQAWYIRQHSDILVAIWDPANEPKPGGTEDSIRLAIRQGLPVVWIHPGEPDRIRVLRDPNEPDPALCDAKDWPGELKKALEQLLDFPRASVTEARKMGQDGDERPAEFYEFFDPPPDEKPWRHSLWQGGLEVLLKMFNLQNRLIGCWGKLRGQAGRSHVERKDKSSPDEPAHLQPYARYKAQADALASQYAGLYRGGFMLNHLLAWFAVLCASLGLFVIAGTDAHGAKAVGIILAAAELTAVGVILWNVFASRAERWQEKSINYRYLAELFRQMDFLAPLGCTTPSSRPPLQYAAHDPRQTWMTWLFRALARQAPPFITGPNAATSQIFDAPHTKRVLSRAIHGWLASQVRHHRKNSDKMSRVQEAIEFWSRVFFYFVLACVVTHFAIDLGGLGPNSHFAHEIVRWCLLLGIILPAAVVTLIGFRNQAECRRLRERSWSMALQLAKLRLDLRRLRDRKNSPGRCFTWESAVALNAAGQAMIDEVTDWQIVYRMHEISEA